MKSRHIQTKYTKFDSSNCQIKRGQGFKGTGWLGLQLSMEESMNHDTLTIEKSRHTMCHDAKTWSRRP